MLQEFLDHKQVIPNIYKEVVKRIKYKQLRIIIKRGYKEKEASLQEKEVQEKYKLRIYKTINK
jgi:hypothetical protein